MFTLKGTRYKHSEFHQVKLLKPRRLCRFETRRLAGEHGPLVAVNSTLITNYFNFILFYMKLILNELFRLILIFEFLFPEGCEILENE